VAARQFQIPGGPFVNLGGDAREFQLPGGPFVNDEEAAVTLQQEAFRWRYDDGDENGATFSAAQDEHSAASVGITKRLRAIVNVSGNPGSPAAEEFQLQYRRAGSPTEDWRKVN
jgi:hypothetical protein